MKKLALLLAVCALAGAQEIRSVRAAADFPLTLDPESQVWRGIPAVFAEHDQKGSVVPGHRTEIRSRWTKDSLYFLYICPYQELNLHPNPSQTTETMSLWEWDVVELFIGAGPDYLRRYKELQVSPQGEWVDLDINREARLPEPWKWDSGFEVKARIDAERKVWYGAMRIPFKSIDSREAAAGNELHLSVCRIQGPKPDNERKRIVWQPGSFHMPAGLLRLAEER